MSYFLNLHGPSEPIETACSSSLVAIHRALQAMQTGSCDQALVGGINTIPTPAAHISFTRAGMLCEDGRCKTFSDRANGYVRGEGVGMLLLKPLAQAEADGDRIYGVLCGSAENHGGRANSLTAPNPKAQAELLKTAYRQAGIDVATVGYIEAHGTGTELGDPIEVNALKAAFAALNPDVAPNTCALGSVKTNIGHLELAAGIAGVIKVLLQLQHRMLAPSLHCERVNPYIDFANSPFYVVREAQPWARVRDANGNELPRRAGVSSFGFGGANAHVVIEEYIAPPRAMSASTQPALLVLSARTEERLQAQAQQLLAALRSGRYASDDLHRIAYTLQVGRDAMEERLGWVAHSLDEAIDTLAGYVDGRSAPELYRGQIKRNKDALSAFDADEDLRNAIATWVQKGKLGKLLGLWVKGLVVDWNALHTVAPSRISLPTYPFAQERHWVDGAVTAPVVHDASDAYDVAEIVESTDAAAPLLERVLQALRQMLATATALPVERIDGAEALESYGIDSLLVNQLNVELGKVFQGLSKTLLYEYQTLAELAGHLATAHADAAARWVGWTADAAAARTVRAPRMRRDTRRAAAQAAREPIAIIGLSGTYPQAPDLDTFWANLRDGRDCIGDIPAERWPVDAYYMDDLDAAAHGKYYVRRGGFVDGFADFDPLFFGILPREAFDMDPQERLFVQSCWSTLEDAGYTRERIAKQHARRVGVFAGITKTGYELHGAALWAKGESITPHTSFGSIANRVSYLLNLAGPSMPVDTMCSASLTAIHEACEHLLRDDCELALAGGVNLYLHPSNYIALCANRMLSADGRCKSFGAGSDGFVPGEGVGSVLLKRLSLAERDNDAIRAVIIGSHINHGGKTNGYTVPNPVAQADLVRGALDRAGVDARAVGYIEAHGTGTALGDPIEITGLTQAFAADTPDTQFCAIGSVKTNIGHLEAAAGIAGLTKLVLQLQHGMRVPSLHAAEPNPNIDFATTPFVVQQTLQPWTREVRDGRELPRIGGVSSFGAGGSNAHVIVREYVAPSAPSVDTDAPRPALFVLSAKNDERLHMVVQRMLAALRSGAYTDADLPRIAYTLQVGREAMDERLAFTAASLADAIARLEAYANGTSTAELHRGQARRGRDVLALFDADDLQRTLAGWIERGRYARLLEVWVKGIAIDWSLLYPAAPPRSIGLPTYPFAQERYWLPQVDASVADEALPLHPLVHRNTSGLHGLRYTSAFSGRERHFVDAADGMRELPQAVQLDMVRAAIALAADTEAATVALDDLQWGDACVTAGALRVHVALHAFEHGVGFELATDAGEVLLQGVAAVQFGSAPQRSTFTEPADADDPLRLLADFQAGRLDLDEIERLIDAGCIV